jgi:heptosyltransferase I
MHILVVRLSAIGDTCHALAVVRNLRDNWSDASISWIIGKTESTLMADIPGIEFIIFDKSKGLSAYADVRRQLAGRTFDVALCMHASARANLLYPLIRSPLKIGFDKPRARDMQWLFTNRQVEPTTGKHALDAMMSFARLAGAKATPLRWDIPISDADRSWASKFRHQGHPLIVISPCSSQRSRNYRNWNVDNFREVVAHIGTEHDGKVVLTGGNSDLEHEYASAISAANDNVADLTGKTNLKQLLALINEADALVCPDSGPAHMATTVGTAVVGLYATSNPDRTGPYLSRQYSVNRYPDAAARFLGKSVDELQWGQRVRSPEAMDLIKISEVTGKIDDLLKTTDKSEKSF